MGLLRRGARKLLWRVWKRVSVSIILSLSSMGDLLATHYLLRKTNGLAPDFSLVS